MKSFITLLIFGVIGYVAYQYTLAPAPPGPAQRPVSAKSSEPDVPEAPAAPPSLDRVVVKEKVPLVLTHAKVKEIHPSGIVFTCDQGIFKVSFDKLPPEYESYYGPLAIADVVPTETPDTAATPVTVAEPVGPRPKPQKTAVEDAQARLVYASTKSGLEDRIKTDQAFIDRWYRQSTFEQEGQVSQTQFEVSKADFDLATAQLNQLEANGP